MLVVGLPPRCAARVDIGIRGRLQTLTRLKPGGTETPTRPPTPQPSHTPTDRSPLIRSGPIAQVVSHRPREDNAMYGRRRVTLRSITTITPTYQRSPGTGEFATGRSFRIGFAYRKFPQQFRRGLNSARGVA